LFENCVLVFFNGKILVGKSFVKFLCSFSCSLGGGNYFGKRQHQSFTTKHLK